MLQKHFSCQIFDQDGVTPLDTFSTDRPEGSTRDYLKNTPEFPSRINGGLGELVLDLALPFDDFGEGTTVGFMNVVKVYSVAVDTEQTETLLYTGFVSRYEPYLDSGEQGVRVTCLGLVSLGSFTLYADGDFTVPHSSDDPTDIGKAVIDHLNTIYSGSLLSYSASSIPATAGTSVSITFTDQKHGDCLRKVGELCPAGWWWKIDEYGIYHLRAKPSTPTHDFTIGLDIDSLRATMDSEGVINDVYVRRSGGTQTPYADATSQATYGTGSPATGKRTRIISDTALTDVGAADERGNKELADQKDYKSKLTLVVNSNYPIDTVRVGDTCRVLNYDSDGLTLPTNMQIVALGYRGDTVSLELERSGMDFGSTLDRFVNG